LGEPDPRAQTRPKFEFPARNRASHAKLTNVLGTSDDRHPLSFVLNPGTNPGSRAVFLVVGPAGIRYQYEYFRMFRVDVQRRLRNRLDEITVPGVPTNCE
jgi:hypothetical protein